MGKLALTKRQNEIYNFLVKEIDSKGFPPTIEEIRKYFFFNSPTAVNDHLTAIEKKGYIKRYSHISRGIEIIRDFTDSTDILNIPILGNIAAGEPIQAIEDSQNFISIPKNELGKSGKFYALRVQGNSMVDEGIFDGDIVIIRRQETAESGQSVVAILNSDQATLKKFYREKGKIRLQPANPLLLPIYPKVIEIRGVVVKIIRNFERNLEKAGFAESKYKRRVDYSWDYSGEKTKSFTHGFHAYPAMFIPQVARRLLQTYSKKGDTVCDIFCGSGTVLVECKVLGRNAIGVDLNPLAVFLARAKTTEINPSILNKTYYRLINEIQNIKDELIERPQFFNIDFWFKRNVVIKLAKIKKAINEIEQEPLKYFFMVAFSETVRLGSNTKNGEFKLVKMSDDKLKYYNPDIIGIFRRKVESNIAGMEEFYKNIDADTWAKVIFGDSSKENSIKENSIDCIITSPPYGDSRTTVAYGQFSRLSAQWIDILDDPDTASRIDNELLGGRSVKELKSNLKSDILDMTLKEISNKDERRAKEVLSFFLDLEKCLKQAFRVLKENKYFCIVIGNRLVRQVRIPTDFIIAEICGNIGFTCEDIFVRNIPNKRMPLKNSPSNISGRTEETMLKESVVILRKSKESKL